MALKVACSAAPKNIQHPTVRTSWQISKDLPFWHYLACGGCDSRRTDGQAHLLSATGASGSHFVWFLLADMLVGCREFSADISFKKWQMHLREETGCLTKSQWQQTLWDLDGSNSSIFYPGHKECTLSVQQESRDRVLHKSTCTMKL